MDYAEEIGRTFTGSEKPINHVVQRLSVEFFVPVSRYLFLVPPLTALTSSEVTTARHTKGMLKAYYINNFKQ